MSKAKEFYLCGQAVVDQFKPEEVSKPISYGQEEDNEKVYIAVINFKEVEKYYNQNEDNLGSDFWARELVAGTMDTDKISLKKVKKENFFSVMRRVLDLSTERNLAMCVHNIAEREGMSPIELFNLLHDEYEKLTPNT